MPLTPLSATLGIKRAAHLLRRATFGTSSSKINEVAALTPQQAIPLLFDNNIPSPSLPIDPETNQEWISEVTDANSGDSELQGYLKSWMLGQYLAIGVDDNLKPAYSTREKITFFYHTYLTTMMSKVDNSRANYFQNALFRYFAFDKEDINKQITDEDTGLPVDVVVELNIKELTKKICVDNAMLKFLDGSQNVKGSPNENYAREMLELFTIGRGLEGTLPETGTDGDYFNYTEQDVRAAANVLTGFSFDEDFTNIDVYTDLPRGKVKGDTIATAHETNDNLKQFSERFDNVMITADPTLLLNGQPTEESVLDEISQLIELIYSKEETAKHLCRRLYRFYVNYEITQSLDDSIITEMAQTLIANNYKIQPVLEELFLSEHFYEAAAGVGDDKFGGIIKSPLDLMLGTFHFFELQLPDYETDLVNFYSETGNMLRSMESMGLNFYEPFEVAGYSAYHQFPIYNRNWISTNYLTQRYNFIRQLLNQSEENLTVDLYAFVSTRYNANAPNAKQFIIDLAPYVFSLADNLDYDTDGGELTKERLRYFLQSFLGFTDYDSEVDMAVQDWAELYANPSNYLEIGEYLKRLFNSMLQSPEYQLF
ncbi:MAG TPA: DUF1800 family protein [Fulvivirga sp.]|nr:DUF1800 family protein [Fulvivirga sp.]